MNLPGLMYNTTIMDVILQLPLLMIKLSRLINEGCKNIYKEFLSVRLNGTSR